MTKSAFRTSRSADGSARVRLPDGRTLGYFESGDPDGSPLLFFHGIPGSRFQGPEDEVAREHGVRCIAPERPGCGLSDVAPKSYSFEAWSTDVAALADQLALERFAIAGYSIGGVFGLACAQDLGHRVSRLGLIGCFAPFDDPADWEGWGPIRGLYEVAKANASGLRQVLEPLGASPETFLAAMVDTVCQRDKEVLSMSSVHDRFLTDALETLRHGVDSIAHEMTLLARPWNIDIGAIRVPAVLWHGLDDVSVPPSMGRHLASVLPNCRAHFVPNEGHLLMLARWPEILTALAY
jgi:pimeloyl-ACP methyl ester carboxylesterase